MVLTFLFLTSLKISHLSSVVFGWTSKVPSVKCFRFPMDGASYYIWEEFCQTPKTKKKQFTCAKHFDLKYFIDGSSSKNLMKSAKLIPTLEPLISTFVPLSESMRDWNIFLLILLMTTWSIQISDAFKSLQVKGNVF